VDYFLLSQFSKISHAFDDKKGISDDSE